MKLNVSLHIGIPIYEQLKDQIRQAILKKELKENDKLQSVRVLSKELSIGIITVKRAYDDLVNEGFIISQTGKGFYVNKVDINRFKSLYKNKMSDLMKEIVELATDIEMTEEEVLQLFKTTKENI